MAGARVNQGNLSAISLGLACFAITGMIGIELDWGRRTHSSLPVLKPISVASVDYPIQVDFILLPLEQGFAETTARPVFAPVRRPPPPPAPPAPAMQKGQFVLLGALITKDNSIALLRDVATGKATRVEQGKEIKGITLTNVYPEKVVLTQYNDTEELTLKIQQQTKLPAASIPPFAPQVAPRVAAQVAPQVAAQAAAQAANANMPAAELGRVLINERRTSHGLPPI